MRFDRARFEQERVDLLKLAREHNLALEVHRLRERLAREQRCSSILHDQVVGLTLVLARAIDNGLIGEDDLDLTIPE